MRIFNFFKKKKKKNTKKIGVAAGTTNTKNLKQSYCKDGKKYKDNHLYDDNDFFEDDDNNERYGNIFTEFNDSKEKSYKEGTSHCDSNWTPSSDSIKSVEVKQPFTNSYTAPDTSYTTKPTSTFDSYTPSESFGGDDSGCGDCGSDD